MKIQPMSLYTPSRNCKPLERKFNSTPENEPNFKGLKGFLTGTAIGSGLTAAGVTLVAGAAVLPAFLGYIVVNGALAGASGHLIEKDNKNEDK